MANKYLNIIGIYLKIDKTVKMRMCTYLTKRCVCEPSKLSKMAFIGWRLETVGNLSTRRSLGTVFRRNCQYFSDRRRARLAMRNNLFLYKTDVAVLTSMQI